MIKKFLEYAAQEDFEPIKSFHLKSELNPKIWKNFKINKEIREELIKIAEDYFDSLDIAVELDDIILTGSNCNFNWSDYSDLDLHLLFDFSKINEDTVLVKKFIDSAGKIWNNEHEIIIRGYDVEIYSQDVNETHISTGVYSLLNNKWIKKPSKENFKPDEKLIRSKSEIIMSAIDDLEEKFKSGMEYDILIEKIKKIWKKIKDGRKAGLQRDGEYSIENLVFKLLRRNGYIEKVIDIRRESYDKQYK